MATLTCDQCGAVLAFEGVRSEVCAFCASPNIVEREPSRDQPTPRFAVAFAGDRSWAQQHLTTWLGTRRLFADGALSGGRVEDMRGVYVPAYLYSSIAHTQFTAEIGEHYYETETYTEDEKKTIKYWDNGDWKDKEISETVTKTRTVTKTEYRPLSGNHLGYVTDVIVSASCGLPDATLTALGPFDLRVLRRFTPALTVGWIHEEFTTSRARCEVTARTAARDQVGNELRAFLPGDSYADLEWQTRVEWESLDPLLVPVWMFVVRYRDDKPAIRIAINGQTGRVAGRAPISWWKVGLAIALVVAIGALIALLIAWSQAGDTAYVATEGPSPTAAENTPARGHA
ncbi:MAG: hypothetical protein ACKV2T_12615 [Kofleriaceae bacterium]